jgi:hypothetical protein
MFDVLRTTSSSLAADAAREPFQIRVGWAVLARCRSEHDAIDRALDLKRRMPWRVVVIGNLLTGHEVELTSDAAA